MAHGEHESVPREHEDRLLRSCNAIVGHHLDARNHHIGHAAGMLIHKQTWDVRYTVVQSTSAMDRPATDLAIRRALKSSQVAKHAKAPS